MRALIKWELNEPVKLIILLLGVSLLSIEFKDFLLLSPKHGVSTAPVLNYAYHDFLSMFNRNTYLILSFMLPFLATLSVRRERDENLALTIYSLGYSKEEILMVKFFTTYVLTFVFVVSAHLLVFALHFSSTPSTILVTLRSSLFEVLVFYALVIFYMFSISYLVAILSPNSYISIFSSFLLLYIPLFTHITSLLPETWVRLLNEGRILTFEFLKITLLVSAFLFGVYIIVGAGRDVR
ncbi:hypothetical protein K1720_04185 [Thermococcus argininiproducens]|uniref:Uncharacterized protein n=1 Tax=Thermococcus argininiproducens TaxID=2866384 RepID=A0A9E7MB43_9EURY|nr:hypothetical protein [Thermococcus argininiproducens]USH00646.1 hypothetical protein K1720_04185 [Thermococcus argininiproducens]